MKIFMTIVAIAASISLYSQDYQLNGKLGIGTEPENKLDVSGDSKLDGELTVTQKTTLEGDTEVDGELKIVSLANSEFPEGSVVKVNADGTLERMSALEVAQFGLKAKCDDPNIQVTDPFWTAEPGIMHTGAPCPLNTRVGIRTDNPLFNLDVFGDAKVSTRLHIGEGLGAETYRLGIAVPSNSNSHGFLLQQNTSDPYRLSLNLENNGLSYFNIRANGSIFSKLTHADPTYALEIKDFNDQDIFSINSLGTVFTRKVVVTLDNFPDYVFADDYVLMPLEDLRTYIFKNRHLPNMPSSSEVAEKGGDIGEISRVSVEKIEELTLYVLQLSDEIKALKAELEAVKKASTTK